MCEVRIYEEFSIGNLKVGCSELFIVVFNYVNHRHHFSFPLLCVCNGIDVVVCNKMWCLETSSQALQQSQAVRNVNAYMQIQICHT